MMPPTTYQKVIIQQEGYDPNIWWPVQWGENFATIKSRETNEVVTLEDIEGFGPPGNCRNLAEDE